MNNLVNPKTILLGYRGSIAHGMYTPNSIDDKDYMGVFIAKPDHYIGIQQEKETRDKIIDDIDLVEYELLQYTRLLIKCNPSVLSLLWVDEKHIIQQTAAGKLLKENKHLFTSQNAYPAFSGYAQAQLARMIRLHEAAKKKNERPEYSASKRQELRDKFGYDTKCAAHAIRLLKMGCEFLETGALNVDRTDIDAEELLRIKKGEFKLCEVTAMANVIASKLKDIISNHCKLPELPNIQTINDLVKTIIMKEL